MPTTTHTIVHSSSTVVQISPVVFIGAGLGLVAVMALVVMWLGRPRRHP